MIADQKKSLKISHLKRDDIPGIVDAFKQSNWTEKPAAIFEKYFDEQIKKERLVWLAYSDNQFCGYVTLKWKSEYKPFVQANTPEIMDLNVLPTFRKTGVASTLLNYAEEAAFKKSDIIGIGVGLYPDYGAAQRLYVKRGYVPNGLGVTYNYQPVTPGKQYSLDDDLVLWFTKTRSQPTGDK